MAVSRRAFLRGAGSLAVALPALEMTHGTAWAATPEKRAKRFVVFFSHGGAVTSRHGSGKLESMGQWFGYDRWRPPYESSTLTTLGDEMKPLEPVASKLLLLRGMVNRAGAVGGTYTGGHGYSNVTALTAADLSVLTDSKGQPYEVAEGPSIEHVIAERLAKRTPTPFKRIDMNIAGHNYGTPFYSAARRSITGESDARKAFDALFAGLTPSGASPELVRLRKHRKSVLDGVRESFATFRKELSSADDLRVQAHFDQVRSIETRLEGLEDIASCSAPTAQNPTSPDKTAPVMADIIVHALSCGLTNVATFNICDITTPWAGAPLTARGLVAYNIGHALGHFMRQLVPGAGNDNDRDRNDWLTEILNNRRWRLTQFKRILDGLDDIADGSAGSLLDTSVMLYTSEFSCANNHTCLEPPVLLAGGGGGTIRMGRQINYNAAGASTERMQTDTSTHNLYTSLLNCFGENDTHFGNDDAWKRGPLSLL